MSMQKAFQYHFLAILVVAIWGVTFVCTKVLIGAGMAPAAIFFCRNSFGCHLGCEILRLRIS